MRRATTYIFAVIVTVTAFALVSVHAHADSPPSKILTITPTTVKPTINPGSSTRGNFQIINQGSQAYSAYIYSAPYSVQGEAYTPDFAPLPGHSNIADWLKFTAAKATVKPGQTLDVPYTVTVPVGTQPGGYYAVAFVETQTGKSKQGVIINERVGEIFYITVAGHVKNAGKLLSWASPFLQKPPLTAALRLENDGGIHYVSDIHISVQDILGHSKYDLTTQKVILPQTIRHIPVSWDAAPPFGLFKVTGTITVLGKPQSLDTKYVLVASQGVRIAGLGIIAVLATFFGSRTLARHKSKRKQSDKSAS